VLSVLIDAEVVAEAEESAEPGTFRFDGPTGDLVVGSHSAEVRCDDGTTVFERPFTLVRPVSNNSTVTGLVAFLVFFVLLVGWRFLFSGRSNEGTS